MFVVVALYNCFIMQEDRGGIVRLGILGGIKSPYDVRYTPNAIIIANAGAKPGKVCITATLVSF